MFTLRRRHVLTLALCFTDVGNFTLFDSRTFPVQMFTYAFADSSFHHHVTSNVYARSRFLRVIYFFCLVGTLVSAWREGNLYFCRPQASTRDSVCPCLLLLRVYFLSRSIVANTLLANRFNRPYRALMAGLHGYCGYNMFSFEHILAPRVFDGTCGISPIHLRLRTWSIDLVVPCPLMANDNR